MICMENTGQMGYHTEKIMHGFRNNIIPIYWGDPVCKLIFNPKAYILPERRKDFMQYTTNFLNDRFWRYRTFWQS